MGIFHGSPHFILPHHSGEEDEKAPKIDRLRPYL
jgi:hypothetical protein